MTSPSQAPLRLQVLIVGCGLGGLAAAYCLGQAGHDVVVIEAATAIGEVGAGIQVSPNVSRLLFRWGLRDPLAQLASEPQAIVLRRYATGEQVGYTPLGRFIDEASEPYYNIHRADFHQMLFDLAAPHMTLRLNSTVVAVDPDAPSVTLASGEVIQGDLIIGADGIKSFVQRVVLGHANPAQATGDAVYRAIIPTELLAADPELKPFVDAPEMTIWMAPRRHVVGYNIRGGKLYNLVMAHPDDGSVESWNAEGSADKMRADYADLEPRVRKIMSFVQSTLKWRLMDRQPLSTWIHPSGRIALLGDACHPMLPYRAQGAAMAIEDAAVLGQLLSHISSIAQLKPLLYAYEALRLPRTAETQASSRLNQHIFHLPDGPEQKARDAGMQRAMQAELDVLARKRAGASVAGGSGDAMAGNPNQWADKAKANAQFGYDADKEAERWWQEIGKYEIEDLGASRL